MDTTEVLGKLFKLQKLTSRKAELALQIADAVARRDSEDAVHFLNMHLRDHHKKPFDMEEFLGRSGALDGIAKSYRRKYSEVCEQIKSLEAELEAELVVPAGMEN